MDSAPGTAALPAVGFPIRTSPDQSLVSGSPTLFAATHVLLRLLSPRHPSCALCSLVISLFNRSFTLLEKTRVQRGSVVNRFLRCRTTQICLLHFLYCACAYAIVKEPRDVRSLKTRQQAHLIAKPRLTWLLLLPLPAGEAP